MVASDGSPSKRATKSQGEEISSSENDEIVFALPRVLLYQLPPIMFAAVLFAMFGVYIYATQAPRNDAVARWKVAETANFMENLQQDLQSQRSDLRGALSIIDQARRGGTTLSGEDLSRAVSLVAGVTSSTEKNLDAIDEFRGEVLSYSSRRFSLSDVLVTSAEAKPKKRAPEDHSTLFDKLNPFLWALMIMPFFIGIPGTVCIRSSKADVRGFGMCMLTSIFGYYAGLGASLFALAAG